MDYSSTNPESPQKFSIPLKNSSHKYYRSVRTQPDEQQSCSLGASKKLSIHYSQKKRIKTQIPQKINLSLGLKKPRKKPEKFPSIKMIKTKIDSQITSQHTPANQADQLHHDPYLNGKIRRIKENKMKQMTSPSSEKAFLDQVIKRQKQFLVFCLNKKYNEAAEILIEFFNYTIDLDLIQYFSKVLMILGHFYLECNMLEQSCFYLNEARKSFFSTGNYREMIEALIKIGEICMKIKMHDEADKFMKKALQYAWYCKIDSFQLKIYEEMGKNYFMMGDTEKAKKYHRKYFACGLQPKNSAIKLSSIQSLMLEGIRQKSNDTKITQLFIIKTSAPIKQFKNLPKFQSDFSNQIRANYYRDLKYFGVSKPIRLQLKDLLADSFFMNEMSEMHLTSTDWTQPLRQRKFLSFDIQRNKHLQELGIRFSQYFVNENKVEKKVHVSQMSKIHDIDLWCSKFVNQAKKVYRAKGNQQPKNRVQLRGINGSEKTKYGELRLIYNKFFD